MPTKPVTTDVGQDVLFGIAQLALERVDGLRPLAPPARVGEFLTGRRAKGMRVERSGDVVEIDLNVTVRYGLEIPKLAARAQKVVREAVASMTGLDVRAVRVNVVGIDLSQRPSDDEVEDAGG
ncbi:MAG: Asp23/Gls24 family envelope stress response protein [Trueperaceae bacterium]|nr:Asp23/Gls24 family envelope stress response protein [Trueperaceae bacterium]